MPRSSKNLPVVVRFKRQSQTVFATATPRETFGVLANRLVAMVNETGGLAIDNPPVRLHDSEAEDDIDLPDADIPKPSFDTADSSDEEDNDDTPKPQSAEKPGFVQLTSDALEFATPADPSDIYHSEFTLFEAKASDKIEKLGLVDNCVIAFKLAQQDDKFDICEPSID